MAALYLFVYKLVLIDSNYLYYTFSFVLYGLFCFCGQFFSHCMVLLTPKQCSHPVVIVQEKGYNFPQNCQSIRFTYCPYPGIGTGMKKAKVLIDQEAR